MFDVCGEDAGQAIHAHACNRRSGLHVLADANELVQLCDTYGAARTRIFQRRQGRGQPAAASPPAIFHTAFPAELKELACSREAAVKAAMLPGSGPSARGSGARAGPGKHARGAHGRPSASGMEEPEEAAAAAADHDTVRVAPGLFGAIVRKQLAHGQPAVSAGTAGQADGMAAAAGDGAVPAAATLRLHGIASADALRAELQRAGLLMPGDSSDRYVQPVGMLGAARTHCAPLHSSFLL